MLVRAMDPLGPAAPGRVKLHVVLRDVVQDRTGQDYVACFLWGVQECPSCMPKTHPPPLQKTRTAFHCSACPYVRLVKPLLLLPACALARGVIR